jgi:hypothetical protein
MTLADFDSLMAHVAWLEQQARQLDAKAAALDAVVLRLAGIESHGREPGQGRRPEATARA